MRTVAIVGASPAGLSAARALRARGYDGRVVLIGAEKHRPYDRPPLSKDFLLGTRARDDLALCVPVDEALDLDWRLGAPRSGSIQACARSRSPGVGRSGPTA